MSSPPSHSSRCSSISSSPLTYTLTSSPLPFLPFLSSFYPCTSLSSFRLFFSFPPSPLQPSLTLHPSHLRTHSFFASLLCTAISSSFVPLFPLCSVTFLCPSHTSPFPPSSLKELVYRIRLLSKNLFTVYVSIVPLLILCLPQSNDVQLGQSRPMMSMRSRTRAPRTDI